MSNTPTLFPFFHDWGTPFKVTREYLTDVQTAREGKEVRVQLRTTPAISLTMRCVFDTERGAGRLLSTWRTAARPLLYYAPLWCDATSLTTAVAAGDAIVEIDTTTRPFFALNSTGVGYAMLWRAEDAAEVVAYAEVEDSLIVLNAGTIRGYAIAGTRVLPVRPMWLTTPVKVSWLSGVAAEVTLSFFDLREQAAFGYTDTGKAAVPASIEVAPTNHIGGGIFFAEATVADDAGIPIPSAVVEWSCHDNEEADGIRVIPSLNTRFARVEAFTPSSTLTATCGAVTTTITAS